MLDRPNLDAILGQLEKIENTTVGNLVAFMHSYNLRFGEATTPRQMAVYRDLYASMVSDRDKILGKPTEDKGDPNPPTPVENPTAVFHGFDPNHLHPNRPPLLLRRPRPRTRTPILRTPSPDGGPGSDVLHGPARPDPGTFAGVASFSELPDANIKIDRRTRLPDFGGSLSSSLVGRLLAMRSDPPCSSPFASQAASIPKILP